MKICFVGLGSIGCRHLKNVNKVLKNRNISFSIDAFRSSKRPVENDVLELLNKQYYDLENLPNDYDITFICTPTSHHFNDIRLMSKHTRNMFIEKPVFDSLLDVEKLELGNDGKYYVACPLRYNAVLQYLKEFLNTKNIFSARAICSTYLPDWRPSVDYRNVYSAHKDMGGGVSNDLIHEWDYLCWLFGTPLNVKYMGGKYSDLEIDSDDLALYIGEYRDKLVSLHLDYFGRNETREIELYTSDDTIIGDIRHSKIRFLKSCETIDLVEQRDDYQCREIEHFLDIIEGKVENDSDINHALNVLKIAMGEWKK